MYAILKSQTLDAHLCEKATCNRNQLLRDPRDTWIEKLLGAKIGQLFLQVTNFRTETQREILYNLSSVHLPQESEISLCHDQLLDQLFGSEKNPLTSGNSVRCHPFIVLFSSNQIRALFHTKSIENKTNFGQEIHITEADIFL